MPWKSRPVLAIATFLLQLASATCFVAMLGMKTTTPRAFSWFAAFAPFWALMCFLLVAVPVATLKASTKALKQCGVILGLLFCLVVGPALWLTIPLAFKLEGRLPQLSMWVVMVPVFVLEGLLTVITVVAIVRDMRPGFLDKKEAAGYALVLVLVLAPILVFECLICKYVENPGSLVPGALFAPILVWLSLLVLVAAASVAETQSGGEAVPVPWGARAGANNAGALADDDNDPFGGLGMRNLVHDNTADNEGDGYGAAGPARERERALRLAIALARGDIWEDDAANAGGLALV